jgi:phosphinothricin acetyltransferase
MNFVPCTLERHAPAILAIFNDAILNSTALYDYEPRKPESMAGWFKAKETGVFPVIGVEGDNGELRGFAELRNVSCLARL